MNKYDKARIALLIYSSKYDWVKKEAEENDINLNFGFSNYCDVLEIQGYINLLKEEQNNKSIIETIKKLSNEMKNQSNKNEKIKLAQQILDLKRLMV